MDAILGNILQTAISDLPNVYEKALVDLRFLIERHTQDRYGEDQIDNYLLLFYDQSLISYRLQQDDLIHVKYFLYYMLFNAPDRADLTAKCIKVLFDRSSLEAIFAGIRYYMRKDDPTTCELIFAMTNLDRQRADDKAIADLLEEIKSNGGDNARQIATEQLNFWRGQESF